MCCVIGGQALGLRRALSPPSATKGAARVSKRARGVTLIEMMLVVTLIALIAAITFPSVSSGIDTMRLNAASDSVVAFINRGMNRAERRQLAVEVAIFRSQNALELHSVDNSLNARLQLPEGIQIARILPENLQVLDDRERSYLLHPGGTVPQFGLELVNRKGARRIVRVDPITGVPMVENL